jgi:hypothetical protein
MRFSLLLCDQTFKLGRSRASFWIRALDTAFPKALAKVVVATQTSRSAQGWRYLVERLL